MEPSFREEDTDTAESRRQERGGNEVVVVVVVGDGNALELSMQISERY